MDDIVYVDRRSGEPQVEQVYGRWALSLLYGGSVLARLFSFFFLPVFAWFPFVSQLYGLMQSRPKSKKKVPLFIKQFGVDVSEFADPVESFGSFNDFFIRKLKPECRPIDSRPDRLAMPADGRYLVFQNVRKSDGFYVKGQSFNLESFLQNRALAHRYDEGSMLIVRLCPSDYHRFHFPCEGEPSAARLIKGTLFSVNPVALSKRLRILWENKRMITEFSTQHAGTILIVEVGATCVGTIHQTYVPNRPVGKGEEKGFFSFGGSCLVLLFEKGSIRFDQDLLDNSAKCLETRGLFGCSFGKIEQIGQRF